MIDVPVTPALLAFAEELRQFPAPEARALRLALKMGESGSRITLAEAAQLYPVTRATARILDPLLARSRARWREHERVIAEKKLKRASLAKP